MDFPLLCARLRVKLDRGTAESRVEPPLASTVTELSTPPRFKLNELVACDAPPLF